MTPIIITIWIVVMAATLIAAGTAFYKGYQASGRRLQVDDMLSHKQVRHYTVQVDAGTFTTVGSKATLLVKEGADGDTAEAEKVDD